MPAGPWQFDAIRLGGLLLAGVLLLAGAWVLWRAQRGSDVEHMKLPVLGTVWVPTGLTVALCLLAAGYHALAYSLWPAARLWAVPLDRWWIVAAVILVVLVGTIALEWLASHDVDEGASPPAGD